MTAGVAGIVTGADHDVLAGYLDYCRALGCSDRALRDRLRGARMLLAAYPDLDAWMRLPVEQRLVDLRRTNAWPLVVYLIGTGRLRLDLDLAVTKNLTGLGAIVESEHASDFAVARDAGRRLGWTPTWVDTVLGECLAVILAWHGGTAASLSSEVLDAFDTQLSASMLIPATTRKAYRCRLASLRQVLFEVGVLDQPPPDGRGRAPLSSASPTSPCPPRFGRCCCATSRPAPVCCDPRRWNRWSTTCCPSPST